MTGYSPKRTETIGSEATKSRSEILPDPFSEKGPTCLDLGGSPRPPREARGPSQGGLN